MREMVDPVTVVRDALVDVPGVIAAFVFGSFARGDFRDDSDVDLFILDGVVDDDLLARRTIDASIDLRREVNVVQMNVEELARRVKAGSGFIRAVLAGPKIWVAGNEKVFELAVCHTPAIDLFAGSQQ